MIHSLSVGHLLTCLDQLPNTNNPWDIASLVSTNYAVIVAKPTNYQMTKRSPRRDHNYPWDQWLDGRTWELTPGEDFTGGIASFRTYLYRQVPGFGYRLRSEVSNGRLYIQALDLDGNELPLTPQLPAPPVPEPPTPPPAD